MAQERFEALRLVNSRTPVEVKLPGDKVSDYFASQVFTWREMREFLPKDVYASLRNSVDRGAQIERGIAEQVASAMKAWAM